MFLAEVRRVPPGLFTDRIPDIPAIFLFFRLLAPKTVAPFGHSGTFSPWDLFFFVFRVHAHKRPPFFSLFLFFGGFRNDKSDPGNVCKASKVLCGHFSLCL